MFLNKLKNKIYKKVIVVFDFSVTRNALVVLIVYIENTTILQNNYKNRFQKLSYKFYSILKDSYSEQKSNKTVSKSDFCNLFQQN